MLHLRPNPTIDASSEFFASAVFKLLRRGGRIKREAILFAFDLLDMRSHPIEERKRQLGELLWAAKPSL